MENCAPDIILAIAQEAPALAFALLILAMTYGLIVKLIPHVVDYIETRNAVIKEREERKKRESLERSNLEGQWLAAMRQSSTLTEQSNDLFSQLLARMRDDEKRNERLEGKLDEGFKRISIKMDDACKDILVIKERID